jgi:hypothetical protein
LLTQTFEHALDAACISLITYSAQLSMQFGCADFALAWNTSKQLQREHESF